jgi:hypothetical protein
MKKTANGRRLPRKSSPFGKGTGQIAANNSQKEQRASAVSGTITFDHPQNSI